MKQNRKQLVVLGILTVAVIAIFITWGLTSNNVGFFLPRRLKKIGAIIISAYCIGYSSVTFQTVTNNKILTPSVMGLDSLYMFIQTVIVFFFESKQLVMMSGASNFFLSVILMMICSCILFLLMFGGDGKSLYFLILSGMIVGSLFGGLSTFMQVLLDPNEFTILQGQMFASFSKVNEDLLFISILVIVLVLAVTLKDYGKLDVLSLGPDHAINLGIDYKRVVFKTLLIVSLLVSVSTALTGPITFLGILVASLSREMFKTYKHSVRILGAVLLGTFALVFGQLIIERVFHFETTISVIINFVGGIYFIYLIVKEQMA